MGTSSGHSVTMLEPLEHSVVGLPVKEGTSSEHGAFRCGNAQCIGQRSWGSGGCFDPIEHSALVRGSHDVGESSVDGVTVSDLIEHSGVRESADPPSIGQLMRNSDVSRDWKDGRQDRMCDDNTPPDVQMEDRQLPPAEEEAIVVGAVGSAAPWFLTGWAGEVEVEFMIDTGCQVTILAASVFEHMCTSDPQMRARLRPCGRRLVSADSSPLAVKGEIELTIVFPGLSFDMLVVVANIGSGGTAGYGSSAVMFATSAGFTNGAIVGGRTIDTTVAPTEACSQRTSVFKDFGGAASG